MELSLRRNDGWIDGRFGAGLGGSLLLHGLVILALIALRPDLNPPPDEQPLIIDVVEDVLAVAPSSDTGKAEPAVSAGVKANKPGQQAPTSPKQAPLSVNDLLMAAVEAHTKTEESASAPYEPGADLAVAGGGTAAQSHGAFGNASLKDFIRAQVTRRWQVATADPAEQWIIHVRLVIAADGTVTKAEAVRDPRYRQNKRYNDIARAARNAALLSSPLQLPRGTPPEMLDMVLELDTRAAIN